jgi:DNA replication protein DnaC
MKPIGDLLDPCIARLRAKLDAGELGDDEAAAQWQRDDEARKRAERDNHQRIQESFLSPLHVSEARKLLRGQLNPPSEIWTALCTALAGASGASILLTGHTGAGKTTAATAYAIQCVSVGWTARHIQASRFGPVAKNDMRLEEVERVDLLILDELAKPVPEWIATAISGVIDERHQQGRQTIGILTAADTTGILGREVVERFDIQISTGEKSWRTR